MGGSRMQYQKPSTQISLKSGTPEEAAHLRHDRRSEAVYLKGDTYVLNY
jgi:hypothetical protein